MEKPKRHPVNGKSEQPDVMRLIRRLKRVVGSGRDTSDDSDILGQIAETLGILESNGQLDGLIREMVALIGIDELLPENYARFQPMVTEGMYFLIGQFSRARLSQKLLDQLRLSENVSRGHRLCTLISDMPTLQKLGQVICRTPGLDPDFQRALVYLEDDIKSVTYDEIWEEIKYESKSIESDVRLILEKEILAEASVCAVVGAKVFDKRNGQAFHSVVKTVKPSVRKNLPLELEMLDRLADFLDKNKKRWGHKDFRFRATFNQVRWLLENEVDLSVEQENLAIADDYYRYYPDLLVPEKLSGSSGNMTIMTRVDGNKITDVDHLTPSQRRRLVTALTKHCILRPIQDIRRVSLFHGDPHAGNIAYVFKGKKPIIIFYDWGMMGQLSRLDRFCLLLLAFGIVMKSPSAILLGIDIVTQGQVSSTCLSKKAIRRVVEETIRGQKGRIKGLLSSIEFLFEHLSYQGVTFPNNFLMFEKSLFTLKGIMTHIDSDFNRDDYLLWGALIGLYRERFRPKFYTTLVMEMWHGHRSGLRMWFKLQKTLFQMGRMAVQGQHAS